MVRAINDEGHNDQEELPNAPSGILVEYDFFSYCAGVLQLINY